VTASQIAAINTRASHAIAIAVGSPRAGQAVVIIRTGVIPRLREMLRLAESARPGTLLLGLINHACLTAARDAITAWSLKAQALQDQDSVALAKAEAIQRTATAKWTDWQIGLLELTLGAGIPLLPSDFGLNAG
jgi:hypothetical protein